MKHHIVRDWVRYTIVIDGVSVPDEFIKGRYWPWSNHIRPDDATAEDILYEYRRHLVINGERT